MKSIFDMVSAKCSKLTTVSYSTSFSLGIYFLDKKFHNPIYNIYGYVRFADEIVDSFHGYDRQKLLKKFREDTQEAIKDGISLNPILNSFQKVVWEYKIEWELIDTFLISMEMDLYKNTYNRENYQEYIVGSAEVVGLMCLRVFTSGDLETYDKLKASARSLGAAFQKVNFLRDLNQDYHGLGRTYFPDININQFSDTDKKKIEQEIEMDFKAALEGIKKLPRGARRGVYLAYVYYYNLFTKIRAIHPQKILTERIRIPNSKKMNLMIGSWVRHQLNLL